MVGLTSWPSVWPTSRKARKTSPSGEFVAQHHQVDVDVRRVALLGNRAVHEGGIDLCLKGLERLAAMRRLSAKSQLARAIGYTLTRLRSWTRYRDDGRIELDNNAAERALRG
jgi:hypothetical protein